MVNVVFINMSKIILKLVLFIVKKFLLDGIDNSLFFLHTNIQNKLSISVILTFLKIHVRNTWLGTSYYIQNCMTFAVMNKLSFSKNPLH